MFPPGVQCPREAAPCKAPVTRASRMDAGERLGARGPARRRDAPLDAELPEMMVHVAVPVPSPHRRRHLPPSPVRGESLAPPLDEPLHERLELGDVRVELPRWCAALLLVLLRGGPKPSGPWERSRERQEAESPDPQGRDGPGDRPISEDSPEPIAQMADGLVRGHASPTAPGRRGEPSQPQPQLLVVRRVEERSHGSFAQAVEVAVGGSALPLDLRRSPASHPTGVPPTRPQCRPGTSGCKAAGLVAPPRPPHHLGECIDRGRSGSDEARR